MARKRKPLVKRSIFDRLPPEMQSRIRAEEAAERAALRTLGQALNETARERWEGRRCYQPTMSQALIAIEALGGEDVRVASIDAEKVKALTRKWLAAGTAPGTVNHRIRTLSAMGVSVTGAWARRTRALKWYLTDEQYERMVELLTPKEGEVRRGAVVGSVGEGRFTFPIHHLPRETRENRENRIFLQYAAWARETGLRVEESLRVRRSHFSDHFRSIKVPGTKTAGAEATLPLSTAAQAIAARAFSGRDGVDVPMFPLSYTTLGEIWRRVRAALGITDKGATLKAFRRSAARQLHAQQGMPLDILRQYLRHGDVQTTMGYLKLTGGYSEEETRRWLR